MELTIFGRTFELRRKALALRPLSTRGGGGFWPVVRESFTGAWQQNVEIAAPSALAYFAVFACTTLIAQDIGKLRLRLVALDGAGIWNEIASPAFSPVLRKPNRYQTIVKFLEQWITSKLSSGNAYVLKERDDRNVVRALNVLDPSRVTPLVTPDGAVYYELRRDDLSGIPTADGERAGIVVPASEIIHDPMVCLFHPLIGVSPIFACGLSALEGLAIQNNQSRFFANGSNPGGVLTAPGAIGDETAGRLKTYWETNFSGANAGKVAVLGDGLKYEQMTLTAVESQLIEQLKWSGETVCSCYHVPPYMIDIGAIPSVANAEPLVQKYYSQCLQSLIVALETALDEGLELPTPYGTELDPDDLIWLDSTTKTRAAEGAIGSGAMSPNEARKKYYGLGPVKGGASPYMQQQNYSLAALADRDADRPFAKPTPAPPPNPPPALPPAAASADEAAAEAKAFDLALELALLRKDWSAIYGA